MRTVELSPRTLLAVALIGAGVASLATGIRVELERRSPPTAVAAVAAGSGDAAAPAASTEPQPEPAPEPVPDLPAPAPTTDTAGVPTPGPPTTDSDGRPLWGCPADVVSPRSDDWLEQLMRNGSAHMDATLDRARDHRLQVLVGEVVDLADGTSCVRYSGYRLGQEYTYPASAMKTIAAVGVMQLVQSTPGWTVDTRVHIDAHEITLSERALEPGATATVGENETTTVADLLESTLVVSSNSAYNGLYDIAGRDLLNTSMWSAGLPTVRIHHRLSQGATDPEVNEWAPAVSALIDEDWVSIADLRHAEVPLPPQAFPDTMLGVAHESDFLDELVDEPMDFGAKNGVSLVDLHAIVMEVVAPELDRGAIELGLSDDSRAVLRGFMEQRPAGDDEEDTLTNEARFKPLSPGVLAAFGGDRSRFRYVNKAGRAYGFHLDSAWVQDVETGRSFFVAVTLWVNDNQVLNDNRYEYESVSFPFFVDLGRVLTEELLLP